MAAALATGSRQGQPQGFITSCGGVFVALHQPDGLPVVIADALSELEGCYAILFTRKVRSSTKTGSRSSCGWGCGNICIQTCYVAMLLTCTSVSRVTSSTASFASSDPCLELPDA